MVFIKITEIQIECKWKGWVKWQVPEGSDGGGRNDLEIVPGMRRERQGNEGEGNAEDERERQGNGWQRNAEEERERQRNVEGGESRA